MTVLAAAAPLPATACVEAAHDGREMLTAQMFRTLEDLRTTLRARDLAYTELERAHEDTLLRLAMAAEHKDDDTGVHVVRIGALSAIMARACGMPEAWSRRLGLAAPMHDIGKIGVPDAVLKKVGALSAEERTSMNAHPAMGAQILGGSKVPLLELAAEVALTHHEKYDGTGYPRGLAGAAIPLSGRIVSLVDYFDALTMDRCYRKALPDERVFEMVSENAATHFDPRVVDAFFTHIDALVEMRNQINATNPDLRGLESLL